MKRIYKYGPGICLYLYFMCCCFYGYHAKAQSFTLDNKSKHVTIPFIIVRNMIVVKVSINDKGPFNFILDTGVGIMIVTDPSIVDSLNIKPKRTIKLRGLGEGDELEAYLTPPMQIKLHGVTSNGVGVAILKTDLLGLSNCAGMPIHGLLGYEFFNNLGVRINFQDSTLTVFKPSEINKFKRGQRIPLTIENNKPYLFAKVSMADGTEKQCKLIMDIGAGHPLLLDKTILADKATSNFISANLGQGFNGPIHGYISRVPKVILGNYTLKNVITSFPENVQEYESSLDVVRDGNLGLGFLKRFDIIIDYPDSAIYIKPLKAKIKAPFEHDMSGLEYYAFGDGYKHVIIDRVEPGSAGDLIGLEKNDEIVAINFKPVADMSIEDIDAIFESGDKRGLLLEVYHDKKYDYVILTLKRRI